MSEAQRLRVSVADDGWSARAAKLERLAHDACRAIEREEGRAHDAGATLAQTALLRAQRELIMRTLEEARYELARTAMPTFVVSKV